MSRYRLTYFDMRGRAEVARTLFAAAKQQYEDIRIDEAEQWPQMKSTTPFGQLPLLEVDDNIICQSRAIDSYLARKFGFAGATEWDSARVDMIMHCCEDVLTSIEPAFLETDEEKKRQQIAKLREQDVMADFMAKFDKLLPQGDDYFVANQLTAADIAFADFADWPLPIDWEKFPRLKALIDGVQSVPRIAEWIAKRPHTYY